LWTIIFTQANAKGEKSKLHLDPLWYLKCQHCHKSLRKVKVDRYEKRQVFDIPLVQIKVKSPKRKTEKQNANTKSNKG
jgi:hypothetical protein